jgi:hypothetical protein
MGIEGYIPVYVELYCVGFSTHLKMAMWAETCSETVKHMKYIYIYIYIFHMLENKIFYTLEDGHVGRNM